jgi:hypothetical protein
MTNTQKIVRQIVEDYYKLDISKVTRRRPYIEARAIYYKLLRDNTHYSLSVIGKTMGKDHATVLYFTRKAKDWLLFDKEFEQDFLALSKRFNKAKQLNPEAFSKSETLEGFWEGEYKELKVRYKYLQAQLKKLNPELAEQFELTNS